MISEVITKEQKLVDRFLSIQDELNKKLHPEWEKQGWAYPDAIFTEATEAYNHLNWEWWRATNRVIDWDQVKLEWVDVAHFLFSEAMVQDTRDELVMYSVIADNKFDTIDVDFLKRRIKNFTLAVLKYDHADRDPDYFGDVAGLFFTVISELDLTLDQFYTLFVGKVCLNQLRWKNGYKKGIFKIGEAMSPDYYVKTWDGVEDNVWLSEHALTLNAESPDFKDKLFADLEAKYKTVYEATWAAFDNTEK